MDVWHQCPVNTVLDTNPLEDHSQLFSLRTRRTVAGIVIDDASTGKKNGEQSYKKKLRFSSPFLLDSKNKYVIRKEIMINNSSVTHVVDICDFEDFLKCLSGTSYVQPREAIIREALNSDLSVFLHVRIAGSTRTFTRSHSQKLAPSPNSHF